MMNPLLDIFAGIIGAAMATFCCIMLWGRSKRGTPEQARTNKILFIVCVCLGVWMSGYAIYHVGYFLLVRN